MYIEKMLKSSRSSLWIRNIQLGLYGVLLGTIGVYLNDREEVGPLCHHRSSIIESSSFSHQFQDVFSPQHMMD